MLQLLCKQNGSINVWTDGKWINEPTEYYIVAQTHQLAL